MLIKSDKLDTSRTSQVILEDYERAHKGKFSSDEDEREVPLMPKKNEQRKNTNAQDPCVDCCCQFTGEVL